MNYRRHRIAFVSAAILLVASAVSSQQTSMVVLSASGTAQVTLKVKAFEKDRHFVIQAIEDGVQNNSSDASIALGIKVADADVDVGSRNFKAYGCEIKNIARLERQAGKLHVETSCEIVVTADKMVTVTVEHRITGEVKMDNITLRATSSW